MVPAASAVRAALAHAGQSAPAECCGVIVEGAYVPLENRATRFDSFVMDMRGFIAATRASPAEAIVHSHVGAPPQPSPADRAMCEKLGLPWLIISWPSGAWQVVEPCGFAAPLTGRTFAHGVHDCFSIIRDGLQRYAGIGIPDYERDWNWWNDGADLIAGQFAAAGFTLLPPGTPPKHCDVFGMRTPGAPVVNHLALFIAPDLILHQPAGRLSRQQLYDGAYQRMTALHLRHGALA